MLCILNFAREFRGKFGHSGAVEKFEKRIIKKVLPSAFAFLKGMRLLYARESYLVKTGLMHTYKTGIPSRPDGSPLP